MNSIKSVIINWYDQGLRRPGPDDHFRTTINFEKKRITVAHVRPNGSYFYKTEVPATDESLQKLLSLFKNIAWEPDYTIPVCDGFEWDMTIKDSTSPIKSHGTIGAPEGTKEIEELIYDMINESGSSDFPMLFGNLSTFYDEDLE